MESLHGMEETFGGEGERCYGCSDGVQYVGPASVACCPEKEVPGDKRIRLMGSHQQWIELDVEKESTQPSPLGLRLSRTPSFVELIQAKLSKGFRPNLHEKQNFKHEMEMNKVVNADLTPPCAEKMKASNFPATFLKIGSWERVSRYDEDLVCKCYFAKRKLVWEVLEGGLKSKIEIQWSDITSLRATYCKNKHDQLELELSKLPHFFRETNPEPRKHTLWQAANDFTGGQAATCRIHLIQFAEGTLEKHYQKLLGCDSRLHMLSKTNFPNYASPYFQIVNQEYQDHRGHLSHLQSQKNSNIPCTPSNISNELFQPPAQLYHQARRISKTFDQGDFQHIRSALDFDTPSSSVVSSTSEDLGISNSDDVYIGEGLQYCEPVYSNIQNSYLNMLTNMTLGDQVNHFSQGHAAACYPSFSANRTGYISADQNALEVGHSSTSEELCIGNFADGCIGGSLQYREPVSSTIHDSFQGSYLNMSTNITLGNQANHFCQGHTAAYYPSFQGNRAEYVFADQVTFEGSTTRMLCEPIIPGCFYDQNRQSIARMNSLASLIGATDASTNTTQQGDFNPLYQIVTENAGVPFSDKRMVPSSWGTTSSHLVESIHGKGLQNNVYGMPSY